MVNCKRHIETRVSKKLSNTDLSGMNAMEILLMKNIMIRESLIDRLMEYCTNYKLFNNECI